MRSETYRVADVPALVVHPDRGAANGRLALWMHYLGGSKEAVRPALEELAVAGFTAVSLDAWQHGERGVDPVPDLMRRVFGGFRAEMWPILGHTVLDALAVVDHAVTTFDVGDDVVAGGVSMGGDTAIALAGIDSRISQVTAMIATPDWTRPGMTSIENPDVVLEQGRPTQLGQWLYAALDPMTHLERYVGLPNITFHLAGDDRHIPRANAEAFADSLRSLDATAADRVRICVHEGLDHLAAGRDIDTRHAALASLIPPPQP